MELNVSKRKYYSKIKNSFIFINYILLINFFNIIYCSSNYITLKVKSGTSKIFCSDINSFDTSYYPDKVYIDGKIQNVVNHTYNIEQSDIYVILEWNNPINKSAYMFSECHDIYEVDLSNFDTSKIINMDFMFNDCQFLTSINLANVDTSHVTSMWGMFNQCKSITSLDLSYFDTSLVTTMQWMFKECEKLEYINMKNFTETNLDNVKGIFADVPNNIIICTNENNNEIVSKLEEKECYYYYINCKEDWIINQKKIIPDTNECVEDFCNNTEYIYEYINKCYLTCPHGNLENDNSKCKCELEKCLTCSAISLYKNLCIECNYNYYTIEGDPLNKDGYFECYQNPKGYYLDNETHKYKKCYYTCENCEILGNNSNHCCTKCNAENSFEIIINNYINCYPKCNNYYYFDKNNNYSCIDSIEYINVLIEDIILFKKNETKEGEEEEMNKYNKLLEAIKSFFTSNNYNLTSIDRGEDQFFEANKILITLTSIENQKNNIFSNMTAIDFGYCETLLRFNYNLTNNQTIYMKKIDIAQEGLKTKKVEYDVYIKSSENNLTKLDLTICGNTKIIIYIPIEINDNIDIDKLNTTSGYFNDICYASTTDDGTDISLNDRKHEFIEGDNIICQEDCDFIEYNYTNKKAKCNCYAKESSFSFADMKIDRNKLFQNFKDIKNLANLNILVCYKKILDINIDNIFHNIGSLILIFIFILHIIFIFIFYIREFDNIIQIIKNIINGIINRNLIKPNKIKKNAQKIQKKIPKLIIILLI